MQEQTAKLISDVGSSVMTYISSSVISEVWHRGSIQNIDKPNQPGVSEFKKKEKTMPFSVNLMRSPVLYRAAQVSEFNMWRALRMTPSSKSSH